MKNKAKKPKYITLKEAAKISGYSPDYIGYLIREGKIPGKQIYHSVAWVTTKEEIVRYKRQKDKGEKPGSFKEKTQKIKGRISGELEVLKLFFKTSRYLLSVIIILILSFTILIVYLFSALKGSDLPSEPIEEPEPYITY